MEQSIWPLLITTLLVVCGWFINSFLNRRHEIAKIRLQRRLETLNMFLEVWEKMLHAPNKAPFIDFPELSEVIRNTSYHFHLYGYENEIKEIEQFINSIEKQDLVAATDSLNRLAEIVQGSIRKELKIKN